LTDPYSIPRELTRTETAERELGKPGHSRSHRLTVLISFWSIRDHSRLARQSFATVADPRSNFES